MDEETGLHYNWHRYYDPMTGRYLTPDPIGLAGGINPFVYTLNNPINWIDPLGLRIQIMGNAADKKYILTQLKKFIRGDLSIDENGMFSRLGCKGDESIEGNIGKLINSDNLYRIYNHLSVDNIMGRSSTVPTPEGANIYLDPNANDSGKQYQSGPFRYSQSTAASDLAHELLGRGIAIENNEPSYRLGTSGRNRQNRIAKDRANAAYERMNMKPRLHY